MARKRDKWPGSLLPVDNQELSTGQKTRRELGGFADHNPGMRGREHVHDLMAHSGGILQVSTATCVRRTIQRMVLAGELTTLLPGVVSAPEMAGDLMARLQALTLWSPDAIVTGKAAARLLFWPSAEVTDIDVITSSRAPAPPGFRFHDWSVDLDHVVEFEGVRLTDSAWTAVWLSANDSGEALDVALRGGLEVRDMVAALASMPHMRGNAVRKKVVAWSMLKPWSAFEREVHKILVNAGITGWKGNWAYRSTSGDKTYILDLAFPDVRVAIEVDGYEYHGTKEAWHRDMAKTNDLQLDDWIVLHLKWEDLADPEALVQRVRAALAAGAARRGR